MQKDDNNILNNIKLALDDLLGTLMFELIITFRYVDINAVIAKQIFEIFRNENGPIWSEIDRFFVAFVGLNRMSFD